MEEIYARMPKIKRKTELKDWVYYIECTKCHQIKELSPSNRYRSKKWFLWYCSQCKVCMSSKNKEYCHQYADVIKEKAKAKYQRRKKEVLQRMRNYYQLNKDRISQVHKKYREDNKDKLLQYNIEHREERSEKYREQAEKHKKMRMQYRQIHKKELSDKQKQKNRETWRGALRLKTNRLIKDLWIRPSNCAICWWEWPIDAHHPDYSIRNEVIFLCKSCHQRLHAWRFTCPEDKIVDLLAFKS